MISHNPYIQELEPPKKSNICVITCHFNFIGWNTPRRNLFRFIRQCRKDEIQLYGIEAYLEEPITKDEENWIHVKANENNICFQKEALLNRLIKLLPPEITKIIVCDHDIWFEKKDWIKDAEKALDVYDFIQPFSTCIWTGKDGKELGRRSSFFKTLDLKETGHPGFTIGFKRSAIEKVWFYPYCLVGGGDTIFAGTISGNWKQAIKKFRVFFRSYNSTKSLSWFSLVNKQNFKCGFTNGIIYHEYHGEKKNRKYNERNRMLKGLNFDNVIINEDGLLEVKSERAKKLIYKYLKERNEDE